MPPKKQQNNGTEAKQSAPQPKKQLESKPEPKSEQPKVEQKQDNGTYSITLHSNCKLPNRKK